MASLSDFDLRFEVATADTPRSGVPAWHDFSPFVRAGDSLTFQRGRSNEQDAQAQPGRASVSLLNASGQFTMGNAGSAFAPLQIRRPMRFQVRVGGNAIPYGTGPYGIGAYSPAVSGNLIGGESSSFEGGTTGGWVPGGSVAPALTPGSTLHPQDGTKGCLITWGAGGFFPQVLLTVYGFIIGRKYTFSAYVYVPTGSPDAVLAVSAIGYGTATSVKNALTRITVTFTATAYQHDVSVQPATAPTAGQQCWFDAAQVDEGTVANAFTTTLPLIYPLWSGFNDVWGNQRDQTTGVARLTCSDRLARAGASLRNALEAEILYDNPTFLYTLGDAAGSTTAGDSTGAAGMPTLNVTQLGAGGSLTFGSGLAPGPDAATVAAFTRIDASNGKYLTMTSNINLNGGFFGTWVEAMVRPTAQSSQMTAVRAHDGSDTFSFCDLGRNASGQATAQISAFGGITGTTLTGSSTLSTTATTHLAVTQSPPAGGVVTVRLYVNGVQEASGTYSSAFTVAFTRVEVGCSLGLFGSTLWDGQISYVAGGVTELSAARVLQHANARTSWSGETTDVRFQRLCRNAGLPSTLYATNGTGASTMGPQPTDGVKLIDALKQVAEAENGVVYVDGAGVLRFANRAARYNAPVGVILDASLPGQVSESFEAITDDSLLINDVQASRPNGPTIRVIDSTSVTNYDTHDDTLNLLVDTDPQVQGAAEWRVYANSNPVPRSDAIEVDVVGYASSGGDLTSLLAADIGSRLRINNLPADTSAVSTLELFIEGIAHVWTKDTWKITFTTSPIGSSGSVFVFDHATFGQFGTGILAY